MPLSPCKLSLSRVSAASATSATCATGCGCWLLFPWLGEALHPLRFKKTHLADTCNVSSVGVVTGAYQRHAGGSGQSAAVVARTEITFSSARHVYPRYAANDES